MLCTVNYTKQCQKGNKKPFSFFCAPVYLDVYLYGKLSKEHCLLSRSCKYV